MRRGFDISATDANEGAIAAVRLQGAQLAPSLSPDRFRVEAVEGMSFADASFDVVISSAVLHFARDEDHWTAMLNEMWRVLKTGGLLFARLATTIGHEARVKHLSGRRVWCRMHDR